MLLFEKDIGGHIRFAGSLSPGTHQIDITAEDYSDNSITQTFEVHIADEGQVFLTYDLNGNLLTRTSDTTVTTYEWDAANRLIAIEVEGQTRSEFLYDGLSRRVGITEYAWNETTDNWQLTTDYRYLWNGLTIAEQRSGTNGATVEKRFFPQGVEIVTGSESGTYTYRTDHLGSIREVVDDQGDLAARFDYSPWGDLATVSGSFDLDFGFTGHFIHQPTGLYLAPFRAYDAGLGRWLNRDPIGEFGDDGFNLYAYVRNNPINRIDLFGLEGLTVAIGELEGAGDALDRVSNQIEAGDRMGNQIVDNNRPGFVKRCWNRTANAIRSLGRGLKWAGGRPNAIYTYARDGLTHGPSAATGACSIIENRRALDAMLDDDWEKAEQHIQNSRNLGQATEALMELID